LWLSITAVKARYFPNGWMTIYARQSGPADVLADKLDPAKLGFDGVEPEAKKAGLSSCDAVEDLRLRLPQPSVESTSR
jgi:hypothetical protein